MVQGVSSGIAQAAIARVAAIKQQSELDAAVKQVARSAVPGTPVKVSYQYSTGPNGEPIPIRATVTISERDPFRSEPSSKNIRPHPNPSLRYEGISRLSQISSTQLTPEEKEVVRALQAEDLKVRIHEAQHLRLAGGLAVGTPDYQYAQGPDGKFYAVGGAVNVQTGQSSDPDKAARDAASFARAALGPGDASSQDLFVARRQIAEAAAKYKEAAAPQDTPGIDVEA